MKKINNKAMLDDAFDLLFMVTAAIFIFFFLGSYMIGGIKESHQISIAEMKEFKRIDNAVNNLRIQLDQSYNLELEDLTQRISQSKILHGKTITACGDYTTKSDCDADTVGIWEENAGIECTWREEKCMQLVTNA